jgi:hypothetical protein
LFSEGVEQTFKIEVATKPSTLLEEHSVSVTESQALKIAPELLSAKSFE